MNSASGHLRRYQASDTAMSHRVASGSFTIKHPTRSTQQPAAARRGVWLLVMTLFLTAVPVDSAWSQGPLRRLGERIRDRAVAPVGPAIRPAAPGPIIAPRRQLRPAPQPLPDLSLPAVPFPDPARVQSGRPPIPPPSTQQTAPVNPANVSRNPRSANFNRAPVLPPVTGGYSQVEQSAQWEQQNDSAVVPATPGFGGLPSGSQYDANSETPAPPRGRLGVVVDTPPIVNRPGLPPRRPRGAVVTEVMPQSPASLAGLQVGDLIVSIEGQLITSVRDMVDELSQYSEGDELRIQYARDEAFGAVALRLAGPDGLAPLAAVEPADAAESSDRSILGGIGSVLGGLLGGQRPASPPAQPPVESPARPAGQVRLPEPPLAPRPDPEFSTSPAPPPEPKPPADPEPAVENDFEDFFETLPAPDPERP
jgi:hypothetical protein